jgi:hypothetical protein
MTSYDADFAHTLNMYFRCKRFENIPEEWSNFHGEFRPRYKKPDNINIFMVQQVVEGLTENNIMLFINWFTIERHKANHDIDGWYDKSKDSGSIQTEFGKVNFQLNLPDTIAVSII